LSVRCGFRPIADLHHDFLMLQEYRMAALSPKRTCPFDTSGGKQSFAAGARYGFTVQGSRHPAARCTFKHISIGMLSLVDYFSGQKKMRPYVSNAPTTYLINRDV
jgi:outer membrane receptor for Fe3+-dicitrate